MAIVIPPTVGEKTYGRLLKLIVTERLKPGETLRQEKLTKKLGVSINTLRSALMLLERDGLVESIPGWGVRVAVLDSDKVMEEFDLRVALECEAARLCAQRMTEEELAEIRRLAIVADTGRNVEDAPADASEEDIADYEMHHLIMKAARSGRLYAAWKRLHLLYKLVWVDRLRERMEVGLGSGPRGIRLVEALATRDPEKAYAAMRGHIEMTRNIALESIGRLQHLSGDVKDDAAWLGGFEWEEAATKGR